MNYFNHHKYGVNRRTCACQKSENPQIYQYEGIKSLEDYDKLVINNTYPLNLLSYKGKLEFKEKIRFRETPSGIAVAGVGYYAIRELGYHKYVELLKLITGMNPVIDGKMPPYDSFHPIAVWVSGYEPRAEAKHACCPAGASMCWVPDEGNPPCPYIGNNNYNNNYRF